MSEPILQLLNVNNWQTVFNQEFVGRDANFPGAYFPIQVDSPILAEYPILRAIGTNSSARETWRLAYHMEVGITLAGDFISLTRVSVGLYRWKLIIVPTVASTFNIKVDVPYWHERMGVWVEEYTGPRDDTTERLIRDSTNTILQAINQ